MADVGAQIWQARAAGSILTPDILDGIADRMGAYAVQADGVAASGKTRAGWKVVATNKGAQEKLGLTQPAMGPIFAEDIYESPAVCPSVPAHGTAIELEIGFVMGTDLDAESSSNPEAVLDAVAEAKIVIENIGRRFDMTGVTNCEILCLSDFGFNASLATGAVIADWRTRDLTQVQAKAFVNGVAGGSGTGEIVLGNPLNALQWAAVEAAKIGLPLRAGDIISTGTMTGADAVKPGDKAVGDFGELGTIEITFE